MTKDEIIGKAKWLWLPELGKKYLNYTFPETIKTEDIAKVPLTDELYTNWKDNHNHFKTRFHIDTIIPIISTLLSIPFNSDKFRLIEKYSGDNDISILYPNDSPKFDIEGFEANEKLENVDYSVLINGNKGATDYHKLYRYQHACSRITNKTINTERKLLVSGDSHMIPVIPVLSCYFKEIVYLDNRSRKLFYDKYKDIEFTDVLFEVCGNKMSKYTIDNLR